MYVYIQCAYTCKGQYLDGLTPYTASTLSELGCQTAKSTTDATYFQAFSDIFLNWTHFGIAQKYMLLLSI